jgi:hypothetical protein
MTLVCGFNIIRIFLCRGLLRKTKTNPKWPIEKKYKEKETVRQSKDGSMVGCSRLNKI